VKQDALPAPVHQLRFASPITGYVEGLAIAHGMASPITPGFWTDTRLEGSQGFMCPSCGDIWAKVQFYIKDKKSGEVKVLAYGFPRVLPCSDCPPPYPYMVGGSLLYALESQPLYLNGFPYKRAIITSPAFMAHEIALHLKYWNTP